MTLAAAHLPTPVVLPVAIAAGALLLWYWARLGVAAVPVSRRCLRRTSVVVILVALPLLVRAVAFIDPDTAPHAYVMTWLFVLGGLLVVVVLAMVDLLNNVRLHSTSNSEVVRRYHRDLHRAPCKADESRRGPLRTTAVIGTS